MNKQDFPAKIIPSIMAGLFLAVALSSFTITYRNLDYAVLPSFSVNPIENRNLFYLTFYIFFFLLNLSLFCSLFCHRRYLKHLFSITSFVFSVLTGYVLNDLFTIKFSIYAACIIVNAIIYLPPKSTLVNGTAILFYTIFLFHRPFLGTDLSGSIFDDKLQFLQILMVVIMLIGLSSLIAYIQFLADERSDSRDTVKHLNSIITQLSVFNHRLQEYAKTSSEEAIKTDRLRFTQDLHDKCGYVFTILITLAEAALSFGEPIPRRVEASLQKIRKQAKEGLQQTRETLYMIREMQEPWAGSIDAIFQIKSIFEDVTGIKVDVEIGNIRQSYGRTIYKVLARILQEAFTNSIRHGKASYILIHFWEFPEELTMTVTDNGIGSQTIVKKIGLAGMEERLAEIGGSIEVSSPQEGGFRIRVKIPTTVIERDDNVIIREIVNDRFGTSHSLGR